MNNNEEKENEGSSGLGETINLIGAILSTFFAGSSFGSGNTFWFIALGLLATVEWIWLVKAASPFEKDDDKGL